MVLSERERRLLQEMETHLLAEDPHLASSLSVRRLWIGANTALTVSGLVIGVLLMGVGVWRGHTAGIVMALVGYVILLASVSVTIDWLRARGGHGILEFAALRRPRRTP
jgi:hypothetical protein